MKACCVNECCRSRTWNELCIFREITGKNRPRSIVLLVDVNSHPYCDCFLIGRCVWKEMILVTICACSVHRGPCHLLLVLSPSVGHGHACVRAKQQLGCVRNSSQLPLFDFRAHCFSHAHVFRTVMFF
jgi:hypothetical protein